MWTTPEKHTERRETLGNTNQNKITRTAGYKKVYEKKNTKGSIQNSKEADETLDKTKTITARQKKTKKSPKMKNSNWKGALQKPL